MRAGRLRPRSVDGVADSDPGSLRLDLFRSPPADKLLMCSLPPVRDKEREWERERERERERESTLAIVADRCRVIVRDKERMRGRSVALNGL